jgi:para-nitrobenzyl esterase
MVYFHDSGYSFGSSYELPSHDGAQMACLNHVVLVSVNHRLDILGFFDAAEIGGKGYEQSENCGIADLNEADAQGYSNCGRSGGL